MGNQPLALSIMEGFKKITVEPFMFFMMFGYTVRLVTLQNLFMDRACRLILNYSNSVCSDLESENNDKEQAYAVTYGNDIYVGFVMLSTIPALIVATLLGPWSDRYTRKYPMIIASTGIMIDSSIQAIITSFPYASPFWFLLTALISGFSGGLIMAMSSTYSYLSDVTDEKSRPTRYAILEFFTIMATPIGSFIGGQIFHASCHLVVMIVSPCSFFVAVIWAVFYIRETKPTIFGITMRQMFRDLWRLDNVKASIKTCVQSRPGNLRLQIWLMIFVSCSVKLIHMGSLAIGFPFTKRMYKWKVIDYSNAWTLFSLMNAVATVTIVPILNKKLMLHEAAVGLIGILSLIAKMVIMSVAFQQSLIYYAWLSGIFYACAGIAIRSRISKLVSKQELGKVFSLLATCESLTPVLGMIVFTQIFKSSVIFYPGLAFATGSILLIPSAIVFIWLMGMPTMSFSDYRDSEEAKNMKELTDVTSATFS